MAYNAKAQLCLAADVPCNNLLGACWTLALATPTTKHRGYSQKAVLGR
jgi:hypothetical protein